MLHVDCRANLSFTHALHMIRNSFVFKTNPTPAYFTQIFSYLTDNPQAKGLHNDFILCLDL